METREGAVSVGEGVGDAMAHLKVAGDKVKTET